MDPTTHPLFLVIPPMVSDLVDFTICPTFLLVHVTLVCSLTTLYTCTQQYLVVSKFDSWLFPVLACLPCFFWCPQFDVNREFVSVRVLIWSVIFFKFMPYVWWCCLAGWVHIFLKFWLCSGFTVPQQCCLALWFPCWLHEKPLGLSWCVAFCRDYDNLLQINSWSQPIFLRWELLAPHLNEFCIKYHR